MHQQGETKRLHLVRLRKSAIIDPDRLKKFEPGPQAVLFAEMKPDVIVFVQVPELNESEFIEVLKIARPSFIFDLRLSPRFDLGRLTRQSAFELFDEVHANYVDATVPLMMGARKESVLDRLRDELKGIRLDRPLFFLFASKTGSIASEEEVLQILSSAGKAPVDLDLVMVPA